MMLAIYIVATVVGVVVGWLLRDRRKDTVLPVAEAVVDVPVAEAVVEPSPRWREPRGRMLPEHREERRRHAVARWRGESQGDTGVGE